MISYQRGYLAVVFFFNWCHKGVRERRCNKLKLYDRGYAHLDLFIHVVVDISANSRKSSLTMRKISGINPFGTTSVHLP
jgi:hypothetical protein